MSHHVKVAPVESSYGVGHMEGRKEGMQAGKQEERQRIAVNLLDIIDDDSIIAKKTGLAVPVIKKLRDEH